MDPIEELHPHSGDWLQGIVFGINDGLVTALVFIMAVSSIATSHLVEVALSEILAGGISMGLGAFLSSRTTRDLLEYRIATELKEIKEEPEEERAELRAIYARKGVSGPLLDRIIEQLTAHNERWLQAMVHDELGVVDADGERPWLEGVLVGGSFVVGAFVPVLPFLASLPDSQVWAFGLTVVTALLLGIIKSRYTLKGPLRNGLELLGIVTIGTIAGIVIGHVLHTA